ncbi:MAG TPA: methylthioribulose 1-phosphate dehydratase [Vicinamibacterales bacterium]|jgi:methylthioribulose-1-phosphate dehydratase|nr:methylthioribulose 1-phosphate dehydratase [Vicinamibacterales bacterium]
MASSRAVRRPAKASRRPADRRTLADAAGELSAAGRRFDTRGWVLGTSGNFSAVLRRDPLRLAITASGGFKGELNADRILEIDGDTLSVMKGSGRPSAETALHVEIVRARSAGAVLHTHSVWSTVLSEAHAPEGGLAIQGFEMLKGLEGVTTHEHREWLPILDNDQDMDRLAVQVQRVLREHPACHGFLLRRHGLYTWGDTLPQAVRHVEILEFLLETVGRSSGRTSWPS